MIFTTQFIALILSCLTLFTLPSTHAAPKNVFRPWKIGMGTHPARPMGVPEPANFEVIIGQIAKPKSAKDLKDGMPPPAGQEPDTHGPDSRLKAEKDAMLGQRPSVRRIGENKRGQPC